MFRYKDRIFYGPLKRKSDNFFFSLFTSFFTNEYPLELLLPQSDFQGKNFLKKIFHPFSGTIQILHSVNISARDLEIQDRFGSGVRVLFLTLLDEKKRKEEYFFGKRAHHPLLAKGTQNERISDYNARVSQKKHHFPRFRRR